ncbi:MAG: hypothetical protein RsTaC01_0920 [Candidatus Paraimprobicoccus trichonymphae]|uniref:Uncharacterized protein n=1 Tax=Candidatus Paraimprobicoccus trichonymphae TaxID=3033793 RepID=A0AA48KZK9_9FIRM|nr:MAG: hypothetical protein RsTaC01_0920 [Candidatus Paraimprobicoccus trichonymphae]
MINKEKIIKKSVYENRLTHTSNDNELGASRPYELGHGSYDPEYETAYENCISICTCQFTPIFKNPVVYCFPDTNFFVNVWFELGTNRYYDYKHAFYALKRALNNPKNFEKFGNNSEILKYVEETVEGWQKLDKFKPKDYTWHHVFMGFEKNPRSILNDMVNWNSEVPDNVWVNPHIPDCEDLIHDKIKKNELKLLSYGELKNILNASDWIQGLGTHTGFFWDSTHYFAIMQLVKTNIHQKTYPHLGSNFQRDIFLGNTPDES